ncbi:MAG: efflux RND transporter periplasmic adaptor subunit [Anaerolineae bacterium]|nr:efflux RND transporter periplasmic adaptor subunit [Anaerolineae bacterium]
MRGDSVIYEPHSFVVTINALHNGVKHTWQYDNFEGRTKIETAVASALEIETSIAGAVVLQETISVFGQIIANPEAVSNISARFSGVIKSVLASIGDTVKKGQTLATIESNESLKLYSIKAPISGVLTQRNANAGEQTGDRQLFTVTDTSTVWVELSIFPADRKRVHIGAPVSMEMASGNESVQGKIEAINVTAEANQSIKARITVNNKNGLLIPGSYVKAQIKVAEHPVSLAVKRSGLQAFRDFTVVYAQIGEEYEVRMLELGRQDNEWIEVLSGLEAGTQYVSKNSFVIKADIEKSGASHDH